MRGRKGHLQRCKLIGLVLEMMLVLENGKHHLVLSNMLRRCWANGTGRGGLEAMASKIFLGGRVCTIGIFDQVLFLPPGKRKGPDPATQDGDRLSSWSTSYCMQKWWRRHSACQ